MPPEPRNPFFSTTEILCSFFPDLPLYIFFLLLTPQTILIQKGRLKKSSHQYFYRLFSKWREFYINSLH